MLPVLRFTRSVPGLPQDLLEYVDGPLPKGAYGAQVDLHTQLRNTATQKSVAIWARIVVQVHHYALIGLNLRVGISHRHHSNLEGPTWQVAAGSNGQGNLPACDDDLEDAAYPVVY